MAKVDIIQTSFAGGEFGPSLFGRTDIAQYQNACQTVENFLVRSYGPAISTPGSTYIYSASNSTLNTRLIKFVFNRSDAYAIEMGRYYFRFYTNGGIVITTGTTPFTLTHIYDETKISDVHYTQLNDVIYLAHPDHPPQKMIRVSSTNWSIADLNFLGGPFLDDNTTSTTITPSASSGTINITASASLFTVSGSTLGHHNSYWKIGGLALTNTTTGLQEEGYVKITYVTNATTATATVIKTLKVATATTVWAEGAWSAVRGYPGKVTFHERRLFFARTDYEPQKVWGSKVFDYENFALDTEADDDGLNLPLASNESNEIQWLASGKSLIAGTFGGAFVINSGSSEPITPSNANASEEVGFGSDSIAPKKIGNFLYYVQKFGRKLREMFYFWDQDTYKAVDRTILSPHILGDGIVDMDASQNPETILYCVLTSGTIATMTREADQDVTAWSRQVTAGTYSSIAIIPSQTNLYDEAWVIVERWINGTQKRFVELFEPIEPPDRQDANIYLHSALTYSAYEASSSSATSITLVGGTGKIPTTVGNVVISGSESVFGGGSALFDGSGDYVTFPDDADWQLGGSGGSCVFDGTGDYLSSADSADWQLGGGTGDFTIDCWVRFTSAASEMIFLSQRTDDNNFWQFGYDNAAGGIKFLARSLSSNLVNITAPLTPTINTWYHVAVVRSGNVFSVYINGTSGASDTQSVTIPDFTSSLFIGVYPSLVAYLNGYLDEIRISDSARWTTTFDPPTTDYSNDANTKLLLHLTSDFTDSSGSGHTVSANGDAAISTAIFIHQGDFTIEAWIRYVSTTGWQTMISQASGTNEWHFAKDSSDNLRFIAYVAGVQQVLLSGTMSTTANTWYHVAVVRSGTTSTLYLNGTALDSDTGLFNIPNSTGKLFIGDQNDGSDGSAGDGVNGYMDEVRISNSARWTANFTPSTSAYSNDSNTDLLLHLDADTQFSDSSQLTDPGTVTASGAYFNSSDVGQRIRGIDANGDTRGEGQITAYLTTSSCTLSITSVFLDASYAAGLWGLSVNTISGLDHLIGEQVNTLNDGEPGSLKTVASNTAGTITLDDDFFIVSAGLPYDQIIYTLPKEAGSQRGTSQGKIQRISEIAFKVNNSYKHFEAGGDADHLDIISATESTISLFTGIIENISFFDDYQRGSKVYIRNSDPLPIELLSIITTVDTFDK